LHTLPCPGGREASLVVITARARRDRLVAALLVRREGAAERERGRGCGKLGVFHGGGGKATTSVNCRLRRAYGGGGWVGFSNNADGHRLAFRVGHLRGDRADPDQLVARELVLGELSRDGLRRAER